MNKNTRMNKLNNAGIDTCRFFNINLPEGLAPGSTISVVINEDGHPMVVDNAAPKSYDAVATQIIENGYVRNTKLYRRWVTSQMFRMLNYRDYREHEDGYHGYLNNCLDYTYTMTMMLEEVRVLGKLEECDRECFAERSSFFTKEVVHAVLDDYVDKLTTYINKLPRRNCKGIPYVTIKGKHYFVSDITKKVLAPVMHDVASIKKANTYKDMYKQISYFVKRMVKLPYNTPKSKDWIDAYKGNGAYYTAKNLIMFHNCKVCDQWGVWLNRDASLKMLDLKRGEYRGEGWRLFAFMKKLIEDNHFNFDTKMVEIYG